VLSYLPGCNSSRRDKDIVFDSFPAGELPDSEPRERWLAYASNTRVQGRTATSAATRRQSQINHTRKELMKAIVWTKYGPPDVLQLRDVEKPVPKDNEVLIRILATTVTAGDREMRSLTVPLWLRLPTRAYVGLRKPERITILGQELAGVVESAGKDVRRFKKGDEVFAATGFSLGAYAQYICLPEESEDSVLAPKPANTTFEQAAAVPVGGLEALHFLRKADIQRGHQVLIIGAGGSIGTIAVQLAKHFGAKVTAVDSTGKLDMLRSIGADQVIDYTKEDYIASDPTYDVILDVVGKSSYSGSIRSLKEQGFYLIANPRVSKMVRGLWTSITSSKKVVTETASRKTEDLLYLKELIEAGKIMPVIDRSYPLEQTAEAHRYVDRGGKKGNVVIAVKHSTDLSPPSGNGQREQRRSAGEGHSVHQGEKRQAEARSGVLADVGPRQTARS